MKKTYQNLKFIIAFSIFVSFLVGCSKLTDLVGGEDKLYFCERYDVASDDCVGESNKFTTGSLTVMMKLKKKIGVKSVNLNITDKKTGEVVDTKPYDVPDADYIYFDGVEFNKPGQYKVSCLKEDGTVIVSNDIEIVEK